MDDIRETLLEEKNKIMEQLMSQLHEETRHDHDIGDEIDGSVEEQEHDLTMLLQDHERERLYLINNALERMDAGEYGFCEECGEAIKKKRLKVLPFARFCIACQQREERVRGKIKYPKAEGYYYTDEE